MRTLNMKLRFSYSGWKQNLLSVLAFILFFVLNLLIAKMPFSVLCLAGMILSVGSILLMLPVINTVRFFEDECLLENEQKLRFVTMIFGMSPSVEKPRIIKRKIPWLFRGKLFRERNAQNGFNELFLKLFIRNFTFTGGYLRLIAVTAGVILLLPPFLKLAVGIGFCFYISIWITGVWDKIILANPICKRYENNPEYYRAKQKIEWFFTILTAVILIIVYALSEISIGDANSGL